ncbi:hypothetical protein [Georgenia alba]|uniref:Uncharacterized protein n=1 Tax=Georgenia alba TaxID=2233858 RepID=A0ABW2Q987_9MICO
MAVRQGDPVVRDWRLPAAWEAQQSTDVFGDGGPPLFVDAWDVMAPPGGAVTVAVCTEEMPGGTPDRRPPTLLLERRALRVSAAEARRRLADPRRADPGMSSGPSHRVVEGRYGPVAVLCSRPWGMSSGPDVRVVAVVVPAGSRDAVVLTFTWDDEHGMEGLEALAARTLDGLELVLEQHPGEPGPGRAGAPRGHGAEFPPQHWVGTWNAGLPGRVAARVTAAVRLVLGGTGFARACWLTWLLLAVAALAPLFLAGTPAAGIALGAVAVLGSVLPLLLAWRSWTLLHGLVTDVGSVPEARPPDALTRPTGLWYYLATALLLAVVVHGSILSSTHVRDVGALVVWVVVHVALVAAECGRDLAPWLRQRLAAR